MKVYNRPGSKRKRRLRLEREIRAAFKKSTLSIPKTKKNKAIGRVLYW